MTVDFTRYTPPGVYVEAQPTNIITPGGIPGTNVTLVGQARGYQMYAQTVTLTSVAVPLNRKGVLPDVEPTKITVKKIDGTVLTRDTHYNLVLGGTSDSTSTIARATGSDAGGVKVGEGDTVVVSFSYADSTYYSPRVFNDISSIEQAYGPALVPSQPTDPLASHVSSPLSLAARIALENGAGQVICVATEPVIAASAGPPVVEGVTLQTRFQEAYAKISQIRGITVVVPVLAPQSTSTTGRSEYNGVAPGLITDARVHVEQASAAGYGRIAVVGVDTVYDDTAADRSFDALATNNTSKRMVLVYPHRMNYFNNRAGQQTEIGGQYLAAALAGRLGDNEVRRGLTQQPVYGLTGIPAEVLADMDLQFRNTLSASGVTVVEPGRGSRLTVRHGTTTAVSNLLDREIGIVRTADAVFQMVASGMEAADLIGDPIDEQTTAVVGGVLTGILETAVQDDIILDYTDVDARQGVLPGGDPTLIECAFTYRPFLPLNYIRVTFSVDLTTGALAQAAQETEVVLA